MRIDNTNAGLKVKAVAGTHVVVLAMNLSQAKCDGLMGFGIHRTDHTENEAYWLQGMKVFPSVPVDFLPGTSVSTRNHPIQGFTWSDLSAKPSHKYTYKVIALYGPPAALIERATTEVTVTTEPEVLGNGHEVYFNRGAAASQAYAQRFQNRSPREVGAPAFLWLSRGLHEALLGFIGRAVDANWGLRVAAYEFKEASVLKALGDAKKRKADVQIIYHAREFDSKDSHGKVTQTGKNRKAVADAGIATICHERVQPPKSAISHNKFIVLLKNKKPVAVLTGSTNFSEGGIYGHSNVVHVVNDSTVADSFLSYWKELLKDPPTKSLKPILDGMCTVPTPPLKPAIPAKGTATVFSPRSTVEALAYYAALAQRAKDALFMTFAFGMNAVFQQVYANSTAPLRFTLMEKTVLPQKDKAKQAAAEQAIKALRLKPENRFGIGSFIPINALDHWLDEKLTGLNPNVRYLHTKYALVDPLGKDPIVVTGSANFSDNSCNVNDENMLVIRGDTRVADIYVGEFMRLYKHFAFRDWVSHAIAQGIYKAGQPAPVEFLDEKNQWWRKWFGNSGYAREREYFAK
jgi:phosphatidylserine/phosphatidylglycerophosphate/cardiolipin synthase-like enzyme